MTGWRTDFENVPDDEGVLVSDGTSVAIAAKYDGRWCFWEGDVESIVDQRDGLMLVELNEWIKDYGPTHWMKRPEPPQ